MLPSQRQSRAYAKASHVLLAEAPEQDSKERVGLITVIAGVRTLALFLDIEAYDARKLGDLLKSSDLFPLIAACPQRAHQGESPYPPEISTLFREVDPSPGLWICRNKKHRAILAEGIDEPSAGELLAYPPCCIEADQGNRKRRESAVIAAYIENVGDDPESIARALLEGRKIHSARFNEFESEEYGRIGRSLATFPFVQHIACDKCIGSPSSQTATLNSQYQEMTANFDPVLHDYLLHMWPRG